MVVVLVGIIFGTLYKNDITDFTSIFGRLSSTIFTDTFLIIQNSLDR